MPTKKKRCGFKVKWQTDQRGRKDAVLYDSRGHSRNLIHFPLGYRITAAEKKRAERELLDPHCKK
jgi:hypothetical protein